MTDEAPKPIGRPTLYSEELATFICSEISSGEKLSDICSTESMPNAATVYRWIGNNKQFCEQYAKAQAERSNIMAEEILEIADESGFDAHVVDGKAVVNGEAINRARLRVDTRKWLMSKMLPKKYGEKLAIGNEDDKPFKVTARIERVITDPQNPNS